MSSHAASEPEKKKKFNVYEVIWVKCEVGSKNAPCFPEMIEKRRNPYRNPPAKILKRI